VCASDSIFMLSVCYCYIIPFSFSLIGQIGNVFVQSFENAENLIQKGCWVPFRDSEVEPNYLGR
jgi:hypothetical protein